MVSQVVIAADGFPRRLNVIESPVPVTVIRFQSDGECTICGRPIVGRWGSYGVPMYEENVLPNDWPGEWGDFPACERCYEVQQSLTETMGPRAFRLLVATWFL